MLPSFGFLSNTEDAFLIIILCDIRLVSSNELLVLLLMLSSSELLIYLNGETPQIMSISYNSLGVCGENNYLVILISPPFYFEMRGERGLYYIGLAYFVIKCP